MFVRTVKNFIENCFRSVKFSIYFLKELDAQKQGVLYVNLVLLIRHRMAGSLLKQPLFFMKEMKLQRLV